MNNIILVMVLSDWIQIIISIILLLTAIFTFDGLRKSVSQFDKQLQLNFFADYTKRYQKIMINLPADINMDDFNIHELENDTKEKILVYMRSYFDLCSEEYYLSQKKLIDDDTWKEWSSGIEYTFSKKAFQEGWKLIALDTKYYHDFTEHINNLLHEIKEMS